jgi:hypothetical protein
VRKKDCGNGDDIKMLRIHENVSEKGSVEHAETREKTNETGNAHTQ